MKKNKVNFKNNKIEIEMYVPGKPKYYSVRCKPIGGKWGRISLNDSDSRGSYKEANKAFHQLINIFSEQKVSLIKIKNNKFINYLNRING